MAAMARGDRPFRSQRAGSLEARCLHLFVNRVAVIECAADEGLGEEARFRLGGGGGREFADLPPGGRAFVLGDGGGALGLPEFIQRPAQILRRTQVVLKQELHRAFARFTSFAHSATSAWRTLRDGEMKNCRKQRAIIGAGFNALRYRQVKSSGPYLMIGN
jgi:hypothetical protein